MASKALSKETRHVVAQKVSGAKKKLLAKATVQKFVITGGAGVGAGIAAVTDAYDIGIPMGKTAKIPLSPIGAAAGILTGALAGEGNFAAAALGFGIGQFDSFIYGRLRDAIEHARAESDKEDTTPPVEG